MSSTAIDHDGDMWPLIVLSLLSMVLVLCVCISHCCHGLMTRVGSNEMIGRIVFISLISSIVITRLRHECFLTSIVVVGGVTALSSDIAHLVFITIFDFEGEGTVAFVDVLDENDDENVAIMMAEHIIV